MTHCLCFSVNGDAVHPQIHKQANKYVKDLCITGITQLFHTVLLLTDAQAIFLNVEILSPWP